MEELLEEIIAQVIDHVSSPPNKRKIEGEQAVDGNESDVKKTKIEIENTPQAVENDTDLSAANGGTLKVMEVEEESSSNTQSNGSSFIRDRKDSSQSPK